MCDTLYRERQLWSGNESVKIRNVSDSFVVGTSALSPGLPRHMNHLMSKFQVALQLWSIKVSLGVLFIVEKQLRDQQASKTSQRNGTFKSSKVPKK